jgi:hypothetical protein
LNTALRRTTSAAAGSRLGTTIKYLRGTTGIGLSIKIKYLRQATYGAAGFGLGTTIKYLRVAADTGLGTTAKYLRRTTRQRNGLGTTIKYLVNQNAGAGRNLAKAHYTKAYHEFFSIPLYWSGFCSKLRAPHRGTSLGPSMCGVRARSL